MCVGSLVLGMVCLSRRKSLVLNIRVNRRQRVSAVCTNEQPQCLVWPLCWFSILVLRYFSELVSTCVVYWCAIFWIVSLNTIIIMIVAVFVGSRKTSFGQQLLLHSLLAMNRMRVPDHSPIDNVHAYYIPYANANTDIYLICEYNSTHPCTYAHADWFI